MNKKAETVTPILAEIANRWSPRAFDHNYVLTHDELTAILEAGRWAPSATNLQPWHFSVVHRGEALHQQISAEALSGFNAAWVPHASSIIFISIPTHKPDGTDYPIAWFDAGLAAQNIMIQAESLGIASHPISGFNHDKAAELLALPAGTRTVAAIIVGKRADASTLEGGAHEREIAPRTRHALNEIVIRGL